MQKQPPRPIYIFRGHKSGVTALTYLKQADRNLIVSGDEKGTIVIWDLNTFKSVQRLDNLFEGRIQTLRSLFDSSKLLVHTRVSGITIFDPPRYDKTLALNFASCDSVFSRSDTIDLCDGKAQKYSIIAFPMSLEQNVAEVRILNEALDTIIAGSAIRSLKDKVTIFDLCLKIVGLEAYLFVAYEDGLLFMFTFRVDFESSEAKHLSINPKKKYNLEQKDFISAYDVQMDVSTLGLMKLKIVCGFPHSEILIIDDEIGSEKEYVLKKVSLGLSTKGVSACRVRQDNRIFALSTWNSKLKIYSVKGKILANLDYHLQKVNDIMFIDGSLFNKSLLIGNSQEINFLLVCASQDGTISLSSIY